MLRPAAGKCRWPAWVSTSVPGSKACNPCGSSCRLMVKGPLYFSLDRKITQPDFRCKKIPREVMPETAPACSSINFWLAIVPINEAEISMYDQIFLRDKKEPFPGLYTAWAQCRHPIR